MTVETKRCLVVTDDAGRQAVSYDEDLISQIESLTRHVPDPVRRKRPQKKTPIPVADGYKPTATRPAADPTPDKPRRGRPPKSADVPATSTALAEVRKAAADANLR